MFTLVSIRIPGAFFAVILSSQSAHNLYGCMGLFLPRGKTFHFSLVNFIRFPFPISPAY